MQFMRYINRYAILGTKNPFFSDFTGEVHIFEFILKLSQK